MDIAFTGGSAQQRQLVRQAVAAVSDRYLDLDKFTHTWNVQFLAPGSIDTTPHDSFKTFMVTQGDGTTQIRDDMPFKGQGPYAGVQFFQESVVHELGHHLLGNGPGEGFVGANQDLIAQLFDSTPSAWNPQDKAWDVRPVEGIAETFKDCFLAARRRVYFNRTREKLAIEKYPEFRRLWRASGGEETPGNINTEDLLAGLKANNPSGNDHVLNFPGGFTFTPRDDHTLTLPAIQIPLGSLETEFPDGVVNIFDGLNDFGGSILIEYAVIVNGVPVVAAGGYWGTTQGNAPGGGPYTPPPGHDRAVENWTEEALQYAMFFNPEVYNAEYGGEFNAASVARVEGPVSSGPAAAFTPSWNWECYWVLIGSLATGPPPTSTPPITVDVHAGDAVVVKMRVQDRQPGSWWSPPRSYIDFFPDYIPTIPISEPTLFEPGTSVPASVAKAGGGLSAVRIHHPGPDS